jgi:hypothetical protein
MALGGRTDILPGGHHGRATVLARLGLSFPEPEAERCEQQGAGGRPVRASAGRPPNATVTPTCPDESTTAPKRPTATRNSAPTETTVASEAVGEPAREWGGGERPERVDADHEADETELVPLLLECTGAIAMTATMTKVTAPSTTSAPRTRPSPIAAWLSAGMSAASDELAGPRETRARSHAAAAKAGIATR